MRVCFYLFPPRPEQLSQNLSIQNENHIETLLCQANIVKNRIYKFYRKNSTHCVRGWTLVRSSLILTHNIHLFIAPTKKKRKTNDIEYPRSHIWSGYIQSKDFLICIPGRIYLFVSLPNTTLESGIK